MKKIVCSLALGLFGMSSSVVAQVDEYQSYFETALQAPSAVFASGESFKLKNVQNERLKVWNAWKRANNAFDEEKLIALAPLSPQTKSGWKIPEQLEPHAVMPFYFGSKGEKPAHGYPLFLYLHGSGPKESEWAIGLKLANMFDDAPSVYFIPQIPNEGNYYRWYQKSKQYIWMKLIRQTFLQDYIDPNRLYVFGISEGGYGSQRLASYYADYWAAAGPMAGGEPLKNAPAENCANIGFSFLTGALDKGFYRDILTTYTRTAFDSLQSLYPDAYHHRIELIPNRAHSIDYRPTTPWLKQWVRQPWPKDFIWEDYPMDGCYRKGFYNIAVNERAKDSERTRYEMHIEGNVVNLKVSNVGYETVQKDPNWGIEMKFTRTYQPAVEGNFTLYLNEHLVDLNKNVVINVNGKKIFDGKLQCNTNHLVNSLSAFYDPMRIYPVAYMVNLHEIN